MDACGRRVSGSGVVMNGVLGVGEADDVLGGCAFPLEVSARGCGSSLRCFTVFYVDTYASIRKIYESVPVRQQFNYANVK